MQYCVIDWERVKVVDKETNRCARQIKEAIWIRKTEPTTKTYQISGQSSLIMADGVYLITIYDHI